MPISYQIDVKHQLVLTTASGTLTDDDVLQFKFRLVRDPDFRPGMSELSDIRNVEKIEVTTIGIRQMVEQDKKDAKFIASHRLAMVASDDVVYGMARMYQTLTESTMDNVKIFRDINEAHAWIESK